MHPPTDSPTPLPPPPDGGESEHLFYQLIQKLHAVIWEADPETFQLYFVSAYAGELFGYPIEHLLTESDVWIRHLHPEDRERTVAELRQAIQKGEDCDHEYRIIAEDGHVVWVRDVVQVETDGQGRAVRLRGVLLDIGRAKRAEAALQESEARARAIFESAAIGLALEDLQGRITESNPALQEILGYTAEQLAGLHLAEITHPDDLAESVTHFLRLAAGEVDAYTLETRYFRADGTARWVRATVSLRRRADGTPWFVIVAVQDITEQKRREEEQLQLQRREHEAWGAAERRAREEAMLREAAEAINVHFTVADVVHQIARSALVATNADGAFVEKVDIHQGELEVVAAAGPLTPPLGARIPFAGSFAEAVIRQGEPELVSRIKGAHRPFPDGFVQRCPDCSVLVVPLVNAGEAVGALMLLRRPERLSFRPDEIARARTFSHLAALAFGKAHLLEDSERKRFELERVMESRTRLIRGFTHDVKNPLGAADGHLQLLEMELQGTLTEQQGESVARTRRALRSALDLIDDLLLLARAEAGQLEVEQQPTDVRAVAHEVVEEYRVQASEASLSLELDVPHEFPVIESDVSRVRQVLSNLIMNAVKHTPGPGRILVRVRAHAGGPPPGEWIAVQVSDTGPGIAPDQLERIFEEFVRLSPDHKGGAGLGLAISRRIARALGGEITVDSKVGEGSTFTLLLPITPSGSAHL